MGRTPNDDRLARERLGYYCDLQSLNSEDAVTWSFFGTLAYMPIDDRRRVCAGLFERLDLPVPTGDVFVWLWRRLPHPEKLDSNGGPEIDFGLMSADTLILGEAKWNSAVGSGQGVAKNRTQLDLRLAYCEELAPRLLPAVKHRVVLGVGRTNAVFRAVSKDETPRATAERVNKKQGRTDQRLRTSATNGTRAWVSVNGSASAGASVVVRRKSKRPSGS